MTTLGGVNRMSESMKVPLQRCQQTNHMPLAHHKRQMRYLRGQNRIGDANLSISRGGDEHPLQDLTCAFAP